MTDRSSSPRPDPAEIARALEIDGQYVTDVMPSRAEVIAMLEAQLEKRLSSVVKSQTNQSVADAAVEYLAAGQTKVESFTITLNDQNGSVITKQIDVTITGTNDAPVITAQDLVGARLSVRARSIGLTAADVDRALGERELVVSWLNQHGGNLFQHLSPT